MTRKTYNIKAKEKVTDGKGMGFGLYTTSLLARDAGLRFDIRSGSHTLQLKNGEPFIIQSDPLQGTIVYLLLRTNKEIDPEILNLILKCGYNAPSGKNLQTWRFTVLTKEKDIEALKAATKETAEKNKTGFFGFENPKVLILVSNDKRNADGCQDASCAAENMMLAALSFGIGSVWLNPLMTIRDKEPVKSVLDGYGIPEQHTVWASVALGYPATDTIPMKKKENVIYFV